VEHLLARPQPAISSLQTHRTEQDRPDPPWPDLRWRRPDLLRV